MEVARTYFIRIGRNAIGKGYVVGDPEMVREHLVRNAGDSPVQQNILLSILEVNAYPDINDDVLRVHSSIIRQKLMVQ